MEPAEVHSQMSKDKFLEVPSVCDSACEDEEVRTNFKLGFSPQPSRRGSGSSEDIYLDTPTSASRRVSFADNFGFSLVSVKEFDCWELPSVSTDFDLSKDIFHTEEYVLTPMFDLPSTKEDLMKQLHVQKAMLESTESLPGSTSVKGIIRVLNMSFEKLVYVRMSLDDWQTHYDILAEYVPNSCDGETDQFFFKISLVPPYQKDSSKVEFCIRYETSVGTFWSNNNGANYVFICQKKKQDLEPVKSLEEASGRQIKGCLKVKSSSKEESSTASEDNNFENSKATDAYIPTIICSQEDKEDLGASSQNFTDVNEEHDEHNEKKLDLMIHQHLIITSAASRDEKNTFSTEPANFPNKAEGSKKEQSHGEIHTDLGKRPLSPSASAESFFRKDIYHSEKYSSGNECSHQFSEEIGSDKGKVSDRKLKPHLSSKEVLDANANPAHRYGTGQKSCTCSHQLMAGDLNKNHEEGSNTTGKNDWECVCTDLKESTGSSKEDQSKDNDEKKQRKYSGIYEKQSSRPPFGNQERKMGHPEIYLERTEANNQDLTTLPSHDTTSPACTGTQNPVPSTTKRNQREAMLTPNRALSTSEGSISEKTLTPVGSPRHGNVMMDYYHFQAEGEEINYTSQSENTQQKRNWNVLESQQEEGVSKTNTSEQNKEQADCKDMWGKRANRRNLKAPLPEGLFTCQETEYCEPSSLADHGITEKAQAVAAYVIKTTLESAPESVSAGGKAIIAKLPQETARSDRPIEVKETAFDPHEGRSDNSYYALCQRDTASIIHDKDFEKISQLDICNVHADEMEKEETMSMYNAGKTHDREKCEVGNLTSGEEPSQVITDNPKAMSKPDFHLGVLSLEKTTFPENTAAGELQDTSRKTDLDAGVHSILNLHTVRDSPKGSRVSSQHTKTSRSVYEWDVAEEKTVAPSALQSIPANSECHSDPTSEIQGDPVSKPRGVSRSSETVALGSRKERHIFQQREGSLENPAGPTILSRESPDNLDEARLENEGLINSGPSQCSSGDKTSGNSALASPPVQESEAQSEESLFSKCINSKMPYFFLFLIFLVTIYYYDLMIGLAFSLFSLSWLYWEGGRQRESVKKK